MAYDVMKAQNYEVKQPGTSDTDLHSDFTDFIVDTALFHRALDVTSGAGNALQNFRRTLHTALANPGLDTFAYTSVDYYVFNAVNLVVVGGVATGGTQLEGPTFDYANTRLGIATTAGMSNIQKLHVLICGHNFVNVTHADPLMHLPTPTFSTDVEYALDDRNGDGFVIHLINNTRGVGSLGGLIANILLAIRNTIPIVSRGIYDANIQRDLMTDLLRVIINYAASVRSSLVTQAIASAYAVDPVNVLHLSNLLEDQIFKTISNVVHKYAPVTTRGVAANDASKELWDGVYMKWNQLSSDAQSFYKANLNFMKRNGNDWNIISEAEMGTSIPDAQFANYRVNIKKVNLTHPCPVFFNLIPKLAVNLFDKVLYTDAAQGKHSVAHAIWQAVAAPTRRLS